MAHDVFISYSSPDKAVADAVCATLESRKIRCWIAPRDVLPGKPYGEALIDALNNCKIMVLVFSASANDSPQVMREVERAVNKGIPIIPLRIENVTPSKSMEYFLSAPHWLDALTPPMERHLQKLADAIEILLGTGDENKPVPGPSGEDKILGSLRKEMLTATSSQELQRIIYKLEDYLAKHPNSVEARLLKDEINTAKKYAKAAGPGQPAARSRKRALSGRGWLLALTAAIVIIVIIVIMFLTGGFGKSDKDTNSSLPTPTSNLTSTPTSTQQPTPTPATVPETTSVTTPTPSAELKELAEEYYTRGLALLEGGQYLAAILEFNKAIELGPSASAYYNRGMSYYYTKEYDKAIADYTKAIELDPDYASAYNFRGDSYLYKGQYDIAIADFSKAISLIPSYHYAYHDRAIAYYYKGEYEKATADLTKAIELAPDEPDYYNLRGYFYMDNTEYNKAIADFNKTLELEPTYDAAYLNRGICYKALGKKAEAIADLEKCIEISQDVSIIQKAQEELLDLK